MQVWLLTDHGHARLAMLDHTVTQTRTCSYKFKQHVTFASVFDTEHHEHDADNNYSLSATHPKIHTNILRSLK